MSQHDTLVTEYIERMSGDILDDRYRPQLAELIRGHSGIYETRMATGCAWSICAQTRVDA